jgi:DNA damage-binding protein 1
MGDSQLVQITPTPNADFDRPTLPIPSEIHSVTSTSFDASVSRKGKGRAISPTFDMEVDDEVGDSQKSGNIIATKGSYVTVLERFKNIAPIVDACLVDLDGGQVSVILPHFEEILAESGWYVASACYVFWREKYRISKYCEEWC